MSIPLLPVSFDFQNIEIYKKALTANSAIAELNGLVYSISNYEILLQPLTAREAVASSEIENIYTTTLELLQAEILSQSDLTLAQKETLNYKKALKKGYDLIKMTGQIGIKDIEEIQAQIVPEKAGIRKKEVFVGNRNVVIYTPPKASEINELLNNLCQYINHNTELDELINMAIIHYQFESIHPFLDGNGRTGRILMVLYLTLKSKLRYPVLFLSGYILDFKYRYYELFRLVEKENKWQEFILFFLEAVEIMAKETTKKVHKIKELEDEFRSILKLQLSRVDSQDYLNYFLAKAFYTQSSMSTDLKITRQTAGKYLEILRKKGYLESRKAGRENLYYMPKFIDILS
jgi:Fic family protein